MTAHRRPPPTEAEIREEIRIYGGISQWHGKRTTALDKAAFEQWIVDEKARVLEQRMFWNSAVAQMNPMLGLKKAMLARAWVLLESAEAEAADALLEFLPEADADAVLGEFFGEG